MLRNGDVVELEVDAVGPRGEGVGSLEGRRLHVPGLFPGERAAVRISHVDRQGVRVWADSVEIVRAHPDRASPPCDRHPDTSYRRGRACDGCAWMSLRPQAQRALRLEQVRALGIPAETIESDAPLGYRASAKRVAFRDRAGRLRLGSFARGSHHGASMLGCRVDHPLIEAGFAALERAAEQLEAARPAVLGESIRHVWIKTNGARLLVTLIVAADADETDLAAWLDLVEMIGPPAGYALAVHEGQGNAVRGGPARPFRGVASLETALCGVPLHIEPLGFLQPNPAVAGRAYEALCALPDGTPLRGARALDLFAGAGVTTALLRRAFDTVRPVESYPESAAALGVPAEDAAEAVRAWVEAAEAPPDLIVANPPRAGFGPALCRALLALAAPRIHVMSCNPHSLARDLERLAPSYRLEAARAFDTLPQTPHVEVVAWLVRTEEAR